MKTTPRPPVPHSFPTSPIVLPPSTLVRKLTGTLELKTVDAGTPSAHRTLVMVMNGRAVRLQRPGAEATRLTVKDRALVGQRVELSGTFEKRDLFRFTTAKAIAAPATR